MIRKSIKYIFIFIVVVNVFSYIVIGTVGASILFPSLKEADITIMEVIKGDYTTEQYMKLGIIMDKRAKESGSATAKFITDKIGTVEYEETTPAVVEGYDTDYIIEEVNRINQEALEEALKDMEETYLNDN